MSDLERPPWLHRRWARRVGTALAMLAATALAAPPHAQAIDPRASVAVGGSVWWDENGNGVRGQHDRALQGAEIEYSWGRVTSRLSVGVDGRYHVDLPAGVPFSVCVASFGHFAPQETAIVPVVRDAGGDEARDSDVDLDNCVRGVSPRSDARHTYDAGFRSMGPASVGDRVWLDVDADGIQDLGETSLPGVTLTLKDTDGTVLATANADVDGRYHLREDLDEEKVPPGVIQIEPDREYKLCFEASTTTVVPPAGVTVAELRATAPNVGDDELDSDVGIDGCVDVDTSVDGADPTVDAGFTEAAVLAASVQGFAWFDLDMDGIQGPGELPLSDVTVTLADAAGATLRSVTTGDDGSYVLSGLPTDTASEICFDQSTTTSLPPAIIAGLRPAPANVADDEAKDSDVTAQCMAITTPQAGSTSTIDGGFGFAAIPSPAASEAIGGLVWFDADRDTIQDPGEPRMAGLRVVLKGPTGASLGSATTDASGRYRIKPLLPDGDFDLCFDSATATNLPGGVTAEDLRPVATDGSGDDTLDSDIDGYGCVGIALPVGRKALTIDAGFRTPGPALALKKLAGRSVDVDDNGLVDFGDEVSYMYEVSNVGTVRLTEIEVIDDRIALVTCREPALEPGETVTCAGAPYRVTGMDVAVGEIVNTAVARGEDPAGEVVESNADVATVPVNGIVMTQSGALSAVPAPLGAQLVTIAFYGDDSSPDIGLGMASALGGVVVLLTGLASLMLLRGSRRPADN